jgi:hypothetical protein
MKIKGFAIEQTPLNSKDSLLIILWMFPFGLPMPSPNIASPTQELFTIA